MQSFKGPLWDLEALLLWVSKVPVNADTQQIRCDAGTPCGPCSKRDRSSACLYLESSRRDGPRKRQRISPLPTPSTDDVSPALEASPLGRSHAGHGVDVQLEIDPNLSSAVTETANTTPTPEPGLSGSRQTESRMLFSSKGEKRMFALAHTQTRPRTEYQTGS